MYLECDKNCKDCKYDECICESDDYSDIYTNEMDLEISRQMAIEKGTYSQWKYNHSQKGKDAQKRYRQSEKGKAASKRKSKRRVESGKNAEYCRLYYYRKKAKKEHEKV